MKGNDGTGNLAERDDWETPQWLFDKLNKQYRFNFDCCASSDNCKVNFFTRDFLGVSSFPGVVAWMNPPFSRAKAMFKHFFSVIPMGVALYRADNFETMLWQDIIFPSASWVFVPSGHVEFEYDGSKRNVSGSRFPSALVGFNVPVPKGLGGVLLFVRRID